MTQYKVINRNTRTQHIMNSNELISFFKINNIREYAISTIVSKKETIIDTLVVSVCSVILVICISKLIMQWI